jgi:formylglycine-generating enzyme required for sulfatase activity
MFAIGKYEISIGEMNAYCAASNECKSLQGIDDMQPAMKMPVATVNGYLKWLNRETGRKYRLPTKTEWSYAAKARQSMLDSNRNCKLISRGIQKGEELVNVATGQQNDWGLVNVVGNVREWVYDKGGQLIVIGGSYDDAMEECSIQTQTTSDGGADSYTGFRVLREINKDQT